MKSESQADLLAKAQYQLANVWRMRGRMDLAIKGYEEALRHNQAYLPAVFELASLLVDQDRMSAALKICREAFGLLPDNELLKRRVEDFEARLSSDTLEAKAVVAIEDGVDSFHAKAVERIENKRGTILFYTDCFGTDGAEQCGHLIMLDLFHVGYNVVCAQGFATHHLVRNREKQGIPHVWLSDDDLYDEERDSLALTDSGDAERILKKVEPDLVFFSDGSPYSSLMAKKEAKRRGIPYLILNHCVNEEWIQRFGVFSNELEEVLRGSEDVVAVSRQNLDMLRRNFRIPVNKGRVIYNGRPDSFFDPMNIESRDCIRDQLALPKDAIACLTVGRMEVMKGYQYIVAAIERLRDTPVWQRLYFIWVGTGTLETRLQSRVSELGVEEHVRFLGHRSDIVALLDASDIFLLPSQYEGMPLSVIEAMAKGLPVVATEVSGTPEALGDSGLLLPDPKISHERLIRVLVDIIEKWTVDRDLRVAIGLSCKKRAGELFRASKMLGAYRELIKSKMPVV